MSMPKPRSTRTQALREQAARQLRQCSSWQTLPEEILLQIFLYIGPDAATSKACVCRNWSKVAKHDALWERWYAIRWPKSRPAYAKSWFATYRSRMMNVHQTWLQKAAKRKDRLTNQIDVLTLLNQLKAKLVLRCHLKPGHGACASSLDIVASQSQLCRLGWQACFTKRLEVMSWKDVTTMEVLVSALVDPAVITGKTNLSKRTRPVRSRRALLAVKRPNDTSALASCEAFALSRLPSGLNIASWHGNDKSVAAISMAISYTDIEHFLLGTSSIKALPDDVDPKYGLHHLNAVVELRADNLDFCEQFRDLDVTIQRLEGQSRGCIHLIGANGQYPHMSTSGQPDITIRTTGVDGLFRGLVNAYWLVADQEHRVIDSQAQTLAAADAELDATDYAYAEGRAYCFMSKSKSSIVKLVCIQEEPDVLLIRDLSIIFPLELLNNHFGTAHS